MSKTDATCTLLRIRVQEAGQLLLHYKIKRHLVHALSSNCMQLEECRQGDTKILHYLLLDALLAILLKPLCWAWRIFCIHGLNCRERFSIKIYERQRLAHDPPLTPL